ncbi:FAD binding domain protein [Corynespora cassiicola Philippines]|uniref:FAD binding domain protein n=1 Tax=Corynespora cassiicola Philippines TaxID=1448308 RepID=A0A2T2NGT7_CORCC|nr:FAD binding domain protein [Corynespora cassiicola Philippines]
MKVIIIGGGIAGLFAARVLREKHDVTILERSGGGSEVGAAVTPGPNAAKILRQYGWDPKRCGALNLGTVHTLDHKGNVVKEQDVSNIRQIFGGDWHVVHRIDLWNELLRLATAPSNDLGVSGQPANVIWNSDVADVDVEAGDVLLKDGSVFHSDLVIGADGIKSTLRSKVVGEEADCPRSAGTSMFRFVLPRDAVMKASSESLLLDPSRAAVLTIRVAHDGRSIVTYPCRNHELLNVGCIASNYLIDLPLAHSWSSPGKREDLLRVFGDFYVRPLLEQAENMRLWELRDHDPLDTYFKGRVLLIGDAAHAMTPDQGQGASQAIEDGEGLSLFIDQEVSRDGVGEVLRDFDRARRSRATKVQNITRSVHDNKTPESVWANIQYNFTYSGIRDYLAKMDAEKF